MFIYKFNKYTGKYYTYDTDFNDIFSPMFDETIHPCDDNFEINHCMHPSYHLTCAFCHTTFPSRSQLFKHLGYMGINIHRRTINVHDENSQLGDYGMSVTNPISATAQEEIVAYHRRSRNRRTRSLQAIAKRRARRDQKRLAQFFEDLNVANE